jgi:CheY-like chemotaxis protein
MSTEELQSQATEMPPAIVEVEDAIPGTETEGSDQGQTQRRRRRRRRKGKGAVSPEMQQRAPQQAPRQKAPQQPRVFQRRDNPVNQNPGNQIQPAYAASNGGGRKQQKRKQRAPKVFVGPMDHSYREVNGNIASGPPSTMSYAQNGYSNGNGNGNGNYFADFNSNYGAPVVRPVVDEDAPTRIFCFIEDLFFIAKIQESAKKLGVKVSFLKTAGKEVLAQLTECAAEDRPALIVFDLNNANIKPLTIIPKIKSKLKKEVSVIGFLSHLQGDLKLKAMEAGCDTVMPRSAFSQGLPNLLRRYGMEEEEDNYPQPV